MRDIFKLLFYVTLQGTMQVKQYLVAVDISGGRLIMCYLYPDLFHNQVIFEPHTLPF